MAFMIKFQDHLLQFDPIAFDERQTVCEFRVHRDGVLHHFSTGELNYLTGRLIYVYAVLPSREPPNERPDPVDDLAGFDGCP